MTTNVERDSSINVSREMTKSLLFALGYTYDPESKSFSSDEHYIIEKMWDSDDFDSNRDWIINASCRNRYPSAYRLYQMCGYRKDEMAFVDFLIECLRVSKCFGKTDRGLEEAIFLASTFYPSDAAGKKFDGKFVFQCLSRVTQHGEKQGFILPKLLEYCWILQQHNPLSSADILGNALRSIQSRLIRADVRERLKTFGVNDLGLDKIHDIFEACLRAMKSMQEDKAVDFAQLIGGLYSVNVVKALQMHYD